MLTLLQAWSQYWCTTERTRAVSCCPLIHQSERLNIKAEPTCTFMIHDSYDNVSHLLNLHDTLPSSRCLTQKLSKSQNYHTVVWVRIHIQHFHIIIINLFTIPWRVINSANIHRLDFIPFLPNKHYFLWRFNYPEHMKHILSEVKRLLTYFL